MYSQTAELMKAMGAEHQMTTVTDLGSDYSPNPNLSHWQKKKSESFEAVSEQHADLKSRV